MLYSGLGYESSRTWSFYIVELGCAQDYMFNNITSALETTSSWFQLTLVLVIFNSLVCMVVRIACFNAIQQHSDLNHVMNCKQLWTMQSCSPAWISVLLYHPYESHFFFVWFSFTTSHQINLPYVWRKEKNWNLNLKERKVEGKKNLNFYFYKSNFPFLFLSIFS